MADVLPPLNALVSFEAVGRLGSLRLAASSLYVSASAVSQQIKALEDWVGFSLFMRHPRGLRLTEPGAAYHRKITAGLRAISEATTSLAGGDSKRIKVGATPSLAACWLIPRLDAFRAAFDGVSLALAVTGESAAFAFEDATDQLLSLTSGPCDVTLRMGTGHWPGMRAIKLADDTAFPVCSPEYRDRFGTIGIADLGDHPLLADTMPERWFDWKATCWPDAPTDLEPIATFSHSHLMLEAAAGGHGVALAHGFLVESYLRSNRLVRLMEAHIPASFSYFAVAESAQFDAPLVQRFMFWVQSQLRIQDSETSANTP